MDTLSDDELTDVLLLVARRRLPGKDDAVQYLLDEGLMEITTAGVEKPKARITLAGLEKLRELTERSLKTFMEKSMKLGPARPLPIRN